MPGSSSTISGSQLDGLFFSFPHALFLSFSFDSCAAVLIPSRLFSWLFCWLRSCQSLFTDGLRGEALKAGVLLRAHHTRPVCKRTFSSLFGSQSGSRVDAKKRLSVFIHYW